MLYSITKQTVQLYMHVHRQLYQVVTSVYMGQKLCTATVARLTLSGLGLRKPYELHINSIILFLSNNKAVIQLQYELKTVMTLLL
jgi:hypothetical protein